MSRLALPLAVVALAAAVLDGQIFFVGMGLGAFAAVLGLRRFRRRQNEGWARLMGASALALGSLAALIATGRFALSWWAIGRLQEMLS